MKGRTGKDKNPSCVLITGASSGIGAELAREFAANGFNLALVARNQERLREVAMECRELHSVSAVYLPCDLRSDDAADVIHNWIRKQGMSVDILVNNAGYDVYGPFSETAAASEDQMLRVNVLALNALTKKFLPRMVKRGRGRIVNIGSTGSFVPTPMNAAYSASKAYVLSFSSALSAECRGTGVTVTCVCPGATHTRFHERAEMQGIRMMKFPVASARYVARCTFRAAMKGRRLVVVGWFNKLSMWAMGLLPWGWRPVLAAFMIKDPAADKTNPAKK